MTRVISGWCGTGNCEGTKKRSPSGKEFPSCRGEYGGTKCECNCHKTFQMIRDEMAAAGLPAPPPPTRTPAPVALADATALSSVSDIIGPTVPESEYPGVIPPGAPKRFDPTNTGRKARGELEWEVYRVTVEWALGSVDADMLTPRVIAEVIDEASPPSTGAITEVFKRWELWGFASIGKNPWQFTGYTPEGLVKGLDFLKARYKRQNKSVKIALKNGIRR